MQIILSNYLFWSGCMQIILSKFIAVDRSSANGRKSAVIACRCHGCTELLLGKLLVRRPLL